MYKNTERQDANFGNANISVTGEEIEEDVIYGEIEEDSVYVNAPAFKVDKLAATSEADAAATFTVDKLEATSDPKCCLCTQLSLLRAACLILIGIIGVLAYFVITSLIIEDDTKVTLDKSDYENLTMNLKDLKEQMNNLTQAKLVLEDENQKLKKENQELEAERKNLTVLTQNIEAEWIKFNANHADWRVDAYCPKEKGRRTCKPCEKGWIHNQSRCYAINDHVPAGRRNWEEAREDCKRKDSDLAVVSDGMEKSTVSSYSWGSSGLQGYWIGLKAEGGKWKWFNGSDLAITSWMAAPPTDGRCVISNYDEWKSVSCDQKQRWICEKAALSV